MRQARTCRLHNHRRPHTYPALHKGPCPRQPPRRRPPPPRQSRRRAGGGGRAGRAPAAAPAEPLVNPLPVAFTRHGTFPERANVPPTSGNSHRGAAHAHARPRHGGSPRTYAHPLRPPTLFPPPPAPPAARPRGRAGRRSHPRHSTPGALPAAAPGGPGRPPPRRVLPPRPPRPQGAGGRGERAPSGRPPRGRLSPAVTVPIPRHRRGLRKAACSSSAYTYKLGIPHIS